MRFWRRQPGNERRAFATCIVAFVAYMLLPVLQVLHVHDTAASSSDLAVCHVEDSGEDHTPPSDHHDDSCSICLAISLVGGSDPTPVTGPIIGDALPEYVRPLHAQRALHPALLSIAAPRAPPAHA